MSKQYHAINVNMAFTRILQVRNNAKSVKELAIQLKKEANHLQIA